MKAAGILLLFAGLAIVVSALLLLPASGSRAVFVLAGVAVEIAGLAVAFRAHYTLDEER